MSRARQRQGSGGASAAAGEGGAPARVLVVTDDPDALDDLVRLAAAAGVEVEVATGASDARSSWARSPLVLVGDDVAAAVAAAGLPRRAALVLVGRAADDAGVWRRAVGLGAEHVVVLPEGEAWLADRMAEAAAGPTRAGVVVAVVGGRGGAGASTLAAAVALAGVRAGAGVLLLDADPLGGGIDLVLGAEDVAGLRWPDLAHAQGRVAPAALGEALPHAQALTVLSWDRGDLVSVPPAAVTAVLDAGVRGFDLVVVDLPRHVDPAARAVLSRAALTWLVVPREVRATAAAARVASALHGVAGEIAVVARGPAPSGLTASQVAEALGLPLAADLRAEPGLAASSDRGERWSRRGPLATAADSLVAVALARRPGVAA